MNSIYFLEFFITGKDGSEGNRSPIDIAYFPLVKPWSIITL